MDADFSHPPKLCLSLIEEINKGADICIASRLVGDGRTEEWPIIRGIISELARYLAMPLTRIKDTMSGYFFLKKEVIEGIALKPLGYKILLEILVKGKYKKAKEIPYVFLNRSHGKSKIGFKVYFQYIQHLFSLYLYKFIKK